MASLAPTPSPRLFRPDRGELRPLLATEQPHPSANAALLRQLSEVLSKPNYPCVAALRSFFREDYLVGIYEAFGRGRDWESLRRDLLWFLAEQRRSKSAYLTMWAIFPDDAPMDEDLYEPAMWNELACLTSKEMKDEDWPAASEAAADPSSREFSFHIGGHALFVVGLHPRSSRMGRRFPWNALVFNAFEQFERLEETGVYARMVATNRRRDEALQGHANPMALAYGEQWESIQFSGRENAASWKCPFRFLSAAEKEPR